MCLDVSAMCLLSYLVLVNSVLNCFSFYFQVCLRFCLLPLIVVKFTVRKVISIVNNYLAQHTGIQQSNLSPVKLTNIFENLASSGDVTNMSNKAIVVSTMEKKKI